MQTIKTADLVQETKTDRIGHHREEMRLEAVAAAHQWQVRQMAVWLAKPIGPKVTHGDDVHRIICAIQIIREQVPAYSVSQLARKSGIPRSTLRDKLNGNSVLTVTDLFQVASAMDVSGVDIMELSAKVRVSTPPPGYVLAEGCSDRWIGAEIENGELTIIPVWNAHDQHLLELWTAKNTEDASMVDLSPADAFDLAADLIAAAKTAQPAGGTD
jgi:transcriptional regulator with XRE-family HTH domain